MGRKLIIFLLFCTTLSAQNKEFRSQFIAMGSAFEIAIVAPQDSSEWAQKLLSKSQAEIVRIEKLISSWDSTSETSQLNANAGIKYLALDPELRNLILRSNAISALTEGAFDISFAALSEEWNFDKSKRRQWPDSASITKKLSLVNYKNIWIQDDSLVLLSNVGMRIGFGGIGKGYAADVVAIYLRNNGVRNGVINASGDIYAWGKDVEGEPWKVAVLDPKWKRKIKLWLTIENQALVTSGDYEKYKLHNGIRYAHIIDPRSGYPTSGIVSATVIAPKAELADALATSIFVLGVKEGLSLINKINNAECIIIDSENKIWYSKQVEPLLD